MGTWYKFVGYILPEGTAALGNAEKRGGIYNTETGAKLADSTALIWNEDRLNDNVNFTLGVSGFTQTDGSEQARIWKPEIREVEQGAILKNDDLLDITVDAELLGFGQDTSSGGGSASGSGSGGQPGANVPAGAITGAPTIAYDAMSRDTLFAYDEFGNVIQTIDANGNIIKRTYDENNRLITEEWTGNFEGTPNVVRYSHNVYDANDRLTYSIDADGRVSEFRYRTDGLIDAVISYPDHSYSAGPIAPDNDAMISWRNGLDNETTRQITRNVYDARGSLIETHGYEEVANSTAVPSDQTDGDVISRFAYDQAGQLLESRSGGRRLPLLFTMALAEWLPRAMRPITNSP